MSPRCNAAKIQFMPLFLKKMPNLPHLNYLCNMKTLQIALGILSLGLGILGIFLPLLPTTPFLLLAASLFFRSSPKLYKWLLNHKHLGPYIRQFREHKAIPLRGKIVSISLVWITISYCAITISPLWWVKLLFILLATGITWHICSYKTLRKEEIKKPI